LTRKSSNRICFVEAPRDLIRVQGLTEQPLGNFKGAMNDKTVSVHNGPV